MARWVAEPYFWYAVLLPASLSVLIVARRRQEAALNVVVWLASTMVSLASAYTEMRGFIGLKPDPYGVYVLPAFPVAYLIAGRYRVASPALCAAGTFLSLFVADLLVACEHSVSGTPSAADTWVGIGAGQPVDGLVAVPLGAWFSALLVARLQRRGVELRLFKSRLAR